MSFESQVSFLFIRHCLILEPFIEQVFQWINSSKEIERNWKIYLLKIKAKDQEILQENKYSKIGTAPLSVFKITEEELRGEISKEV